MAYIHNTYKDIAAILDRNSNRNVLVQLLTSEDFDFELLVKMGSQHLVLPAIYCNLKDKDLLLCLPKDLVLYLEELTSINRNRNLTIIEEVKTISSLFNDKQIEHVFLKGAALLVSGYYKDLGERMVGDVDILVHPDQLFKARDVLLEKGYVEAAKSLTDKYFDQKHLPRLTSDSHLAAVEIHRKLLHKSVKGQLEPLKVLKNKQVINGVSVGHPTDLLIHTILNFQINDLGYYYNYLGLRNAYDALIILDKIPEPDLKKVKSQKYIRSFFDKINVYFKLKTYHKKSIFRFINTQLFLLKQNNKFLSKVFYGILNAFKVLELIVNRMYHFIVNASYRKESSKDYKRILKLIKKRMYPF